MLVNDNIMVNVVSAVNKHYEGNRSKHQVTRSDLHQAKSLQELEYQEMLIRHQKALKEQMEEDARIALLIHQEEMRCTSASTGLKSDNTPELDRLMAERIQAKEKMKVLRRKLAREKREVQRLNSGSGVDSDGADASRGASDTITDLSEFCLKPPPGLTEEELRVFQAEQDEELARFLQRQEAVRNAAKEKLHVIEAQDHQIAKILQDQERQKVRRHKEKARLRAKRQSPGGGPSPTQTDESRVASAEPNRSRSQASSSHFHNVAIDLDPTYHKSETPPDDQLTSGVHFARLCRVSPTPSNHSASPCSTGRRKGDAVYPESSDAACVPVVPGHKRRDKKNKTSKKKGTEGCKTQ